MKNKLELFVVKPNDEREKKLLRTLLPTLKDRELR